MTYPGLDSGMTEKKLCSNVIAENRALVCKEAGVPYSEI